MNTDPIAERARALLQAEALASGDFGEINFNEPRWNPWRIAEHAMVKFAAALTTEGRPERLEREALEAAAEAIWSKRWFCVQGDFQPGQEPVETDEPRRFAELALATPQPQTNLQENLAGSQTDAPASEEVERLRALVRGMAEHAPFVMPAQHGKAVCDDYARAVELAAVTPTPSEGARDSALEEAAIRQNDAMRQELAAVGNLTSDLARALNVDQANDDGSWPDLPGRIRKLIDALRTAKPEQEDHVVGFADTDVEQPKQAGAGEALREALDRAVLFSAYNRNDPQAIRFVFRNDEDRLTAANAVDAFLAAPQGQNSGEGEA